MSEEAAIAERAPHVPDAEPIEMPEDVNQVIDPLSELGGAEHAPEPEQDNDIDAMVRAAKAERDGAAVNAVRPEPAKVCLIVDDSRVVRKVSSKIAKSLGFVTIEAQDGTEALARCKKAMPALVLTDWDMPEMDGLEFVKRLRAIPTPKAPTVVFCTSKNKPADVHAGIQAGADDYIVKPFDETSLKAKLARLGLS